MTRVVTIALLLFTCTFAVAEEEDKSPSDAEEANRLAIEATNIIRRMCGRCHKGSGSSFYDARSVASMIESGYLTEGEPDSSYLFERMFDGSMPPKNRPQLPKPTGAELESVREWILAGATVPPVVERDSVSLESELQAVYRHLTAANSRELPNLRFFSLRNLFNDPNVDDQQLLLTRMALVKALNCLSWERDIVLPVALNAAGNELDLSDPAAIYFAVDINRLGWSREHWNTVLKRYPYAVSYEAVRNEDSGFDLDELDNRIRNLRRSSEPVILRADWFISVATKPPIYHSLLYDLEIPSLRSRRADPRSPANPLSMTDLDLEIYLGIDVTSNITRGISKRSGFTESGVSGQNRLIERHPLPRGGAYWKSYDFKDSNRRAILTEFPLGPKFDRNPHNSLAFDHDGGEIIFNLPNGLQAYMLVDGAGNRIDAGPIEVVSDSLKTSGNEQIVTGVSCIACHRSGMIDAPVDEVRPFSFLVGDAKRLTEDLYPEPADMDRWIKEDSDLFMRAAKKCMGAFVKGQNLDQYPEPVAEVARRFFLEPMTIETVAAELSIAPQQLSAQLNSNDMLQDLGLRVLLREGGSLKRAAWESPLEFPMMKEAAREFGFSPRN